MAEKASLKSSTMKPLLVSRIEARKAMVSGYIEVGQKNRGFQNFPGRKVDATALA